jgi:DNA-binding NtrC family response regulator
MLMLSVTSPWRANGGASTIRSVADDRREPSPVPTRRVLLLDTPDGVLRPLGRALSRTRLARMDVQVVVSAEELLQRLGSGLPYDLVALDCLLGDGRKGGIEILRLLRSADPLLVVVAVAERGDVELAAKAIAAGASDFLVRGERLGERIRTLLGKVHGLFALQDRNRQLGEQNRLLLEERRARERLLGSSPEILAVLRRIERVAPIPRHVLIVGERGTGKELVARAIHEAAGGAGRPFVAVNCAALTDSLLETELFGHEKGAFTGADSRVQGKFEQAQGGSLFLDEIGHMSLGFQQKILRVVEYGVLCRVGGRAEIRSDARIVSATNVDLEEHMRRGLFLRDLYDRLAFEVIRMPPLRERRGDVELLAHHFLGEFGREIPALGNKRLAPGAIAALCAYDFPGNVRELRNIIERAAYRETDREITAEDLGLGLRAAGAGMGQGAQGFDEQMALHERRLVTEALASAQGNQAQAARALGLPYHRFRYYLRKHRGAL